MINYYVISAGPDGISIREFSKDRIVKDLTEEGGIDESSVLTKMPNNSDPNEWGEAILIIKGNIVIPRTVTIVTRYDID